MVHADLSLCMFVHECAYVGESCKWLDIADAFTCTYHAPSGATTTTTTTTTTTSITTTAAAAVDIASGGSGGSEAVSVFRDDFRLDGTHAHPRYAPLVLLPALAAELTH